MEITQTQQNDGIQTVNNENNSLKETPSQTSKQDSNEILVVQKLKGSSVFDATVNIVKSGLGTGILFLPSVFMECGIILSCLLMILTGVVCYFCWVLLSRIICFQESLDPNNPNNQSLTLERVSGILFSNNVKIFLEIITMVYAYGTCLGYCVFIRDSTSNITDNGYYILLVMFAIFLPLSLFKQIQNLAFFNYFALTTLFVTIGCIIVKSIIQLSSMDNLPSYTLFAFSKIPLQFGVFSFAYDINGVVTEVHASMQDKSQFKVVLRRYLTISCALGIIVGVLGYLAFGNDTESSIFLNFDSMNGFRDALSVLYSLTLTASILLFCFPLGYHVDNLVKIFILRNSAAKTHILLMIFNRTIIFFSFGILSIYVSNLNSIFNLLGCVFCTILTYTLPALLIKQAQMKENYLKCLSTTTDLEKAKQNGEKLSNIKLPRGKSIIIACILVIIFGLGGGISGIVSTIKELSV